MKKYMTLDEAIEHGVAVGLAVAAGTADSCRGMTAYQVAVTLDAMARGPVATGIAKAFLEQVRAGREPTPALFRDMVVAAIRAVDNRGAQ